ncbi:hypothetical protein ACFYYR_27725 [Streptomyces sp. NPDC001922]|uniref:hypothetical protein n=1 Tax=Streptomyces sp. NPDC001922 TaxID=3364624 RepID=UPI0036C3C817
MQRVWIAAAVAVLVAAGTAGCSAENDDKPARTEAAAKRPAPAPPARRAVEQACQDGTYRWFNAAQRSVVTDLSPTQQYRKGREISSERNVELVRFTPTVAARGPALPSDLVIQALAQRLKADGLAGDGMEGSPASSRDDGSSTGTWSASRSGRYLTARSVRLVEADFTYTCRGTGRSGTTSGHVLTWRSGADLDVVRCAAKPGKKRPAWLREAARLGCREGDPARS